MLNMDELLSILQYVNLIKVKFNGCSEWKVLPLLMVVGNEFHTKTEEDLPKEELNSKKAILKFQKNGFEYIINADFHSKSLDDTSIIIFKPIDFIKFFNKRRHFRFDTNVIVKFENNLEGKLKNLSYSGALIETPYNSESPKSLSGSIIFNETNKLKFTADIMRKASSQDNWSYGLQFQSFEKDSQNILVEELSKIEKAYLNNIKKLDKNGQANIFADLKIAILSTETHLGLETKEVLVRLGAENYYIFAEEALLLSFIRQEEPKIIIFDLNDFDEKLIEFSILIKSHYNTIGVLISIPFEYYESIQTYSELDNVIFKPFIFNELEKIILPLI